MNVLMFITNIIILYIICLLYFVVYFTYTLFILRLYVGNLCVVVYTYFTLFMSFYSYILYIYVCIFVRFK